MNFGRTRKVDKKFLVRTPLSLTLFFSFRIFHLFRFSVGNISQGDIAEKKKRGLFPSSSISGKLWSFGPGAKAEFSLSLSLCLWVENGKVACYRYTINRVAKSLRIPYQEQRDKSNSLPPSPEGESLLISEIAAFESHRIGVESESRFIDFGYGIREGEGTFLVGSGGSFCGP